MKAVATTETILAILILAFAAWFFWLKKRTKNEWDEAGRALDKL